MKRFKSTEGFFLIDTVISLLVVSVIIIEILVFALNTGSFSIKTNVRIIETIETSNRSAVELFEY